MVKTCSQCGNLFTERWRTQKFCCKACASAAMVRKVQLTCPQCGKVVYVYKGTKFCSKECADSARRGVRLVEPVIKICPVCSNTFERKYKAQRFCSRQCASIGKEHPYPTITEEQRLERSIQLKQRWQDPKFRQIVVDRMRSNDPVYMPGVVDKANATRQSNQSYSNNFKYGNGKISPYEQLVKDKLEPLGFIYNHAIATKLARDAYPDAHFSVNYKPDFVNLDTKLCIEVDGAGHSTHKEKAIDSKKEKCLSILGYTVVRFTHEDIDRGVFDTWLNSYQKDT